VMRYLESELVITPDKGLAICLRFLKKCSTKCILTLVQGSLQWKISGRRRDNGIFNRQIECRLEQYNIQDSFSIAESKCNVCIFSQESCVLPIVQKVKFGAVVSSNE
jgi:hypothetical protein